MIDPDLDDTHLCIKCKSTVVGLEAYIAHRKTQCTNLNSTAVREKKDHAAPHADHNEIISTPRAHLDHIYDTFSFTEPEHFNKESTHGGKTTKSLADAYELPYELGADVFFSSLQLQSVQSAGPSTSGKQSLGAHNQTLTTLPQRQQKTDSAENIASADGPWMSDTHAASGGNVEQQTKNYEVYKPITYIHESPEASEEEDDDVEVEGEMDDDDEDYDPLEDAHASGGKWKPPTMRHSPPVVPESHTGGKWRPEQRPTLHVAHAQLTRISPNWDEHVEELDTVEVLEGQHPPVGHTKGKWIPGTKMQRLEYKEEVVELAKSANQEYWCNICCRRLKNKTNYENHLKTGYHLKRAEPERQLEKAELGDILHGELSKSLVIEVEETKASNRSGCTKKRKRRANFIKCQLCKLSMLRHLVGKHLISHYHYRRMQNNPTKSLHMILENIHSIVLQSPFQCRPCRFYTNTEEMFLQHWSSSTHQDATEGLGKFWCSYCHFECEDNNQMRRHLLGVEHKEVILAINRSVPICISKPLSFDCNRCGDKFRYNAELRRHMLDCHPGKELCGTISNEYQNRYECATCADMFRSKIALQRHEKNKHSINKYFCSICKLVFNTPCQARRHRKTLVHRKCAAEAAKSLGVRRTTAVKNVNSCGKCDFIASSDVEAMLHELAHHKSGADCNVASKTISSTACAGKNNKLEQKPTKPKVIELPKLKCKDCDEFFDCKESLKEHRDVSHPLLSHVCLSCGESFALPQALGRHTRNCQPKASTSKAAAEIRKSGENSFTCDLCDFSAPFESELIFHRLHHTLGPLSKTQIIECPICSKEFRKYSLRCHLRQHTNEKNFICEVCDMKFARSHNLKDHMKSVHGVPVDEGMSVELTTSANREPTTAKKRKKVSSELACSSCPKTFSSPYMLKKHSVSHAVSPSVNLENSCKFENCKYVAASATLLRVHAASHAKEQLKCSEPSCSYEGKSLLHLKRHSGTHLAPTKLYACDKCEFKARIKGHIRRHMLTHSGEKPFRCPHCQFRCSTFDNLRKHVLKTGKHPGKFIYECQRCAKGEQQQRKSFKTNSYVEFQAHKAAMHAHALEEESKRS